MSRAASLSVESFRPSPHRLWIRYRPRHWPAASGHWVDWSHGTLGHFARSEAEIPRPAERHLSDLLYLPPTRAELEPSRRLAAAEWTAAGTPVLLQLRAGLDAPPDDEGPSAIWDALHLLLTGKLEELGSLPRGAQVVWPLISGISDSPEVLSIGLENLAKAGVHVVQPLVLELSATARRQLADAADEATFDRLFHGEAPSEREVARRVAELGLAPFVERPLPRGSARLELRRRCSGQLRLAAFLLHRLGRPEIDSQRLLRAARWIDREDHDLAGLVRSGNLALVDWLEGESAGVVEDVAIGARTRLVDQLRAEYVGTL